MKDHIFVHIPATAGVSIRAAVGSRRIVHDLARNHYQREGVDWGKYWKYSVVRNTYDRAVSICSKLHGCVMGPWLTPEVFQRIVARDVAAGKTREESIAALCEKAGRPHQRGYWLSPEMFRKWVADGMQDTRIHNNPLPETARMCTPQLEYLTSEDGEWLVDHLVRFEHLREDMLVLCDLLDVPRIEDFDNKNPSARDLGYQEYYDRETRERIEDHFSTDLEQWNHPFEEE